MDDYKYAAQLRAEELAEEAGNDFFDLPQDKQLKLYQQALDDQVDRLADLVDEVMDREKEQ